ncbi:MAG TPA: hypothetical protein VLA43_10915, partial [Longimicrobiales bacterium]|nr:hypothetical protein [Longimicrobiales bacterium]
AAVLPVSLGVWLRGGAPSPTWRLFAGGVVWAMGWLIPWTLLDYFPDRYLVHVYLPLVIALGAGLTLLAAPEGRTLREGFHALSVPGRFLVAALAALPAAAVTAPAVLSLLDLSGISLVQFRFHLVLVVGMALGVGARFATTGRMPLGVATVFFPMAVAVLLGLGNGPGVGNRWLGEHWRVDAAEVLGPWTLTLAGGAALAFAAARAGRGRDAHGRILGWSLAYAVGLAAVWTVTNHLPTLARRTYAVEGVAAELSERYGPDQLLGVSQAASILIGTPFRYRELSGDAAAPDVILTATHAGLRHPVLERILAPYRLVREYELPGLEYLPASRSPPVVVGLYERVDPPVGAGMSPGAGRLGLVAGEPTAGAPAPPGFSAPSPGVRR